MKKKTINIYSIDDIAEAIISNVDLFKIGATNILINGDNIISNLIIRYADKSFKIGRSYFHGTSINISYPSGYTTTDKQAFDYFYSMWLDFCNPQRILSLRKMLAALNAEYDPISNYDKISEIKTGNRDNDFDNTRTITGTKTNTNTENGSVSDNLTKSGNEVNSGTSADTHLVTSYDDTSFRNDSQDNNTNSNTLTYNGRTDNRTITYNNHKNENVETYNNYKDILGHEHILFSKTINGVTDNYSSYNNIYEHTSGNIGVTTSQQMIESELAVRRFNLIDSFVQEFVQTYLFYI